MTARRKTTRVASPCACTCTCIGSPAERARTLLPHLLAELAKLAATSGEPEFYSTRKGGGPSWLHDREWKELAPTIPGAFRPNKSARWIFVPRESVDEYRRTLEVARSEATIAPANDGPASAPWSPAVARAALDRRAAGGRR